MTRRLCALAFTWVVAGASATACSASDESPSSPSNDAGPGITNDAASLNAPVTQTVGTSGGTVSASGASLTIPPGALSADTSITITPSVAPVPSGYTGLSGLFTFGPDGTVFLKPVTIDFTLMNPGANPTVYWSNAQGGFDPMATQVTATTASASITHFSEGFVGVGPTNGGGDASASNDASGSGDDAGPSEDAAAGDDAGMAGDAGSSTGEDASTGGGDASTGGGDAGTGGSDASTGEDSSTGGGDASTGGGDAGSAGSDAGAIDAGTVVDAAADAGVLGITVNIDGVATTFAASASVQYSNGLSTIQANDNASSTYWQLQLVVGTVQQEVCSPSLAYPVLRYTHFTAGVEDSAYATTATQGYCNVVVTSTAQQSGQAARGVFSGGVDKVQDGGTGGDHLLTGGSYDVIF